MITLATAAADAALDAVTPLVDAGSANAAGRLELLGAGDVVVAGLDLSNPAFAAASAGAAAINAVTNDPSAAGGDAVAFRFLDRDRVEVLRGVVGASQAAGVSMVLSTTSVAAGQPVSVSSYSLTLPVTS